MAGRGPTVLRPIVMGLHWATLPVLVAWLAAGLPGWAVALHAAAWAGISLAWGLRGGPSPALSGAVRRIAWLTQAALLGLYLLGAGAALAGLPIARGLLVATLGLGTLHGVFNVWRSSVLGDGCLRRMTPRAMH